MIRYNRARLAC